MERTNRRPPESALLTEYVQGVQQAYPSENICNGQSFFPAGPFNVPPMDNNAQARPRGLTEEDLTSANLEQKGDLASSVLWTLCSSLGGRCRLAELLERLKDMIHFTTSCTLYQFLKDYPKEFKFDEKEDVCQAVIEEGEIKDSGTKDDLFVTASPSLQLCISHSTKAGSCTEGCRGLHVCKYYILDSCEIADRGGVCLFGHDMGSEHNKSVMRRSLLQMFPEDQAKRVLMRLEYRNATTVPVVCTFYNSRRGCKNGRNCQFLHICKGYINGTCQGGELCNYSHNIMADQPAGLLAKYAMSPVDRGEDVVRTLRAIALKTSFRAEAWKQTTSKTESKKIVAQEETAETDDIDTTSSWQWAWSYKTASGNWTDIKDNFTFEEKYREYKRAMKMTFAVNNIKSEVNFSTLKGQIEGGDALQFRRTRKAQWCGDQ